MQKRFLLFACLASRRNHCQFRGEPVYMFSMPDRRASLLSLVRPAASAPARQEAAAWSLAELQGRLCELSGGAAVTFAFRLINESQQAGEPAAWIGGPAS